MIDLVAELPRDDNGKLYKRLLRAPYWQNHYLEPGLSEG